MSSFYPLGWINLAYVRVPGVLQRFGICYFIVAVTGVLAARFHGDEDEKVNDIFLSL